MRKFPPIVHIEAQYQNSALPTFMSTEMRTENNLDNIICQLGLGQYQIRIMILLSITIIVNEMIDYAFVFIAKNPGYRCRIPQCNDTNHTEYNPPWLIKAVPFESEKPASCQQFRFVNDTNSQSEWGAEWNFLRNETIPCQYGYVYDTIKISIVNNFDIHCDENTWKLTLVGTTHYFGYFLGLPLSGLFSDRFGRRTLLVYGMGLSVIMGIIQVFSTNYLMFLIFEFLYSIFSAGILSCAYKLAVELVGPSSRVICGILLSCCSPLGGITIALLAWCITSWRATCLPSLLIISYRWLVPESVRWLLIKKRHDEAKSLLAHIARVNNKIINPQMLENCLRSEENAPHESLTNLWKSRILRVRFIVCCFCWMTCTFVYYGITLNSVTLVEGNHYLDFILNNFVEIPAYFGSALFINKFGRRLTEICSFIMAGFVCLVGVFISGYNYYLQLFITLFGKFAVAAAFSTTYVITSEIFPTSMRHTAMGTCSMIGRIESMTSPQMPLLAQLWESMPMLLFGLMAITAGILSLVFSETLGTRLPNIIEEAENMSKQEQTFTLENNQT